MFLPNCLKTTKALKVKEAFTKFVEEKFEKDKTEKLNKITEFISEFIEKRGEVEALQDNSLTEEGILDGLVSSMTYLSLLRGIERRFKFGADKGSLKLEFCWREISTSSEIKSFSLLFEQCSVRYNIAVLFFKLGLLAMGRSSAEDVKVAKKYFEKCAFAFKEILSLVKPNDIPKNSYDFSEVNIKFLIGISMGMAAFCVYRITKIRGGQSNLKMKICIRCSSFFTKASTCQLPYKRNMELINFYKDWFKALAYFYCKDQYFDNYNKTAKGLGMALSYADASYKKIESIEPSLEKVKNYVDIKEVKKVKEELEGFITKNFEENNKNAKEEIIEESDLPSIPHIEGLISFAPYDKKTNPLKHLNDLNYLNSEDIIGYINHLKENLKKFLEGKFKNIDFTVIKSKDIKIEKHDDDLTEEIKNNVEKIKSAGGTESLMKELNTLEANLNELKDNVTFEKNKLIKEEAEEEKNKQFFKDKWQLASNQNKNYLKELDDFLKSIEEGKMMIFEVKDEYYSNGIYWDTINNNDTPTIARKIKLLKSLSGGTLTNSSSVFNELNEHQTLLDNEVSKLNNYVEYNPPILELEKIAKKQSTEKVVLEKELKEIQPFVQKIEEEYNFVNKIISDNQPPKGSTTKKEDLDRVSNFLNNCLNFYEKYMSQINNWKKKYEQLQTEFAKTKSNLAEYLDKRNLEKKNLLQSLDSYDKIFLSKNSCDKGIFKTKTI